jgi:hypothetical protein
MSVEETKEAVKDWIIRAAKMRSRETKSELTHRQMRDAIVREYYAMPSYVSLVTMMNAGQIPERVIPVKSGGIYECKSELGISLSYQDILNIVGPNCADQTVQFKLIDKMDEMGAIRFEGMAKLRARNAAWRVGRDIFDRMFLLLFDYPAGTRIKPNDRAGGRLMFTVQDTLITDMQIMYI